MLRCRLCRWLFGCRGLSWPAIDIGSVTHLVIRWPSAYIFRFAETIDRSWRLEIAVTAHIPGPTGHACMVMAEGEMCERAGAKRSRVRDVRQR
jgi:hypothetical protein